MKISIICPTRKRTSDVTRLLKSLGDTTEDPKKVEILFVIDDDDDESMDFIDRVENLFDFKIKKVIIERNKYIFSDFPNKALPFCEGELLLAIGDDGTFNTHGWDTKVRHHFDKISHKISLLHFNDLSQHCRGRAGHLVLHKNWVDVVGYFSPPYFDGDWGDWWMTWLADGVGVKVYAEDIILEHLNVWYGKSNPDQTYEEHKIRREKMPSPDSPDHPKNINNHILQKNIKDLLSFIANHKA